MGPGLVILVDDVVTDDSISIPAAFSSIDFTANRSSFSFALEASLEYARLLNDLKNGSLNLIRTISGKTIYNHAKDKTVFECEVHPQNKSLGEVDSNILSSALQSSLNQCKAEFLRIFFFTATGLSGSLHNFEDVAATLSQYVTAKAISSFVEVDIINITFSSPEQPVQEHRAGRTLFHVHTCSHTVSREFSQQLCSDGFGFSAIKITKIPMQSGKNASKKDYDVQLLINTEGCVCKSSKEHVLSWSRAPRTDHWSGGPARCAHVLTPLHLGLAPTSCLLKHVLSGKTAFLASPEGTVPSHILTSQSGLLYLHTLATPAPLFQAALKEQTLAQSCALPPLTHMFENSIAQCITAPIRPSLTTELNRCSDHYHTLLPLKPTHQPEPPDGLGAGEGVGTALSASVSPIPSLFFDWSLHSDALAAALVPIIRALHPDFPPGDSADQLDQAASALWTYKSTDDPAPLTVACAHTSHPPSALYAQLWIDLKRFVVMTGVFARAATQLQGSLPEEAADHVPGHVMSIMARLNIGPDPPAKKTDEASSPSGTGGAKTEEPKLEGSSRPRGRAGGREPPLKKFAGPKPSQGHTTNHSNATPPTTNAAATATAGGKSQDPLLREYDYRHQPPAKEGSLYSSFLQGGPAPAFDGAL